MGLKGRKRISSRVSSGGVSVGGSMAASHGMGPLQEAMREAMNRDKKARASEKDPFAHIDQRLDKEAAAEAAAAAAGRAGGAGGVAGGGAGGHGGGADLDYPGFEVEDQVWNKLLELRATKMAKEGEVRRRQRLHAKMKRELDALQAEADAGDARVALLERRKRTISDRALAGERNLEVLVRVKQGQDEVPRGAVVTDYRDAALMPVAAVAEANDEVRRLGGEKVATLGRIRTFRQSINLLEWGKRQADSKVRDLEEHYVDLQLLRVTRKLQLALKGGADPGVRGREALQRMERRLESMRQSHQDKAAALRAKGAVVTRALHDRCDENEQLARQLAALRDNVAVREAVYRSRLQASGSMLDPKAAAAARMQRIIGRRTVVDLVARQTEEIEALRQELDRLRQRTFPSFAHAARSRLAVGAGGDAY
ncbi:unnamed protein product [Phaeothamnion confervicola]